MPPRQGAGAIVPMDLWQLANASAVYGAGFLALFLLFALLYQRAVARRDELGLTALDVFDAQTFRGHQLVSAGVGAIALAVALFAPLRIVFISPMCFALMGPGHWWYGRRQEQRRAAFVESTTEKV